MLLPASEFPALVLEGMCQPHHHHHHHHHLLLLLLSASLCL
jgi:hypothetical protein